MKFICGKNKFCRENLPDFLHYYADKRPNRLFLQDEIRSYSFIQSLKVVQKLSYDLCLGGVKKDMRVIIRCTRSIDTILIMLALQTLDAVVMLADASYKIAEFISLHCNIGHNYDYCITNEEFSISESASLGWVMLNSRDQKICPVLIDLPMGKVTHTSLPNKEQTKAPQIIMFKNKKINKNIYKPFSLNSRDYIIISNDFNIEAKNKSILIVPLSKLIGLKQVVHAIMSGGSIMIPQSTDRHYISSCIGKYGINNLYETADRLAELINIGSETFRLNIVFTDKKRLTKKDRLTVERNFGAKLKNIL